MPPVEVAEGLFFFERGYLSANHLALAAARPVLIDTGYLTHWQGTRRMLEELGLDLGRTQLIVSTHTHCDHIGGNRIIQRYSDCSIALHRIGCHFVTAGDDWATWSRYYGQQARFFAVDQYLDDGDELAVGPHVFRVIHLPGHAADQIALYCREQKLLISSDALWKNDLAVITERVEGSAAIWNWLESLERLADLEVRLVCPGHGPMFSDVPAALARTRARLESYIKDRRELGRDQLKRIFIFTLLMHPTLEVEDFYELLNRTPWFPETCAHYFDAKPRTIFNQTLEALAKRGVVRVDGGRLQTTVRA